MNSNFNINYECFFRLIDNKHKINDIFKNVINNNLNREPLQYKIKTDKMGCKYMVINQNSKLYKVEDWFYKTADQFFIQNNYVFDINTASLISLYKCTGVFAYRLKSDIKLLILDKELVEYIITNFINKLKGSSSIYFYNYMKSYLRIELGIEDSKDKNMVKNITSNELPGDYCTGLFLSFISHILGYQGVIYTKLTGIYKLSNNGFKILINDMNILERDKSNKYDWTNWGIKDYILPQEEFVLNPIYNNAGFKAYEFYKSSLNPNIKITEEYDFGTININKLISINNNHNKDRCMRGLINFINKHKLKFLCVQDLLYEDIDIFTKFIIAENLYSTVGDFERHNFKDNDLCNVIISSSKLLIINISKFLNSNQYYIIFKHPNYNKKTFINTKLDNINQLNELNKYNANYIIGNINIVNGTDSYSKLQSMNYALNNDNIFGTNIDNLQTTYILSKLPKVTKSVVPINYKYSDHKSLICKV